MVSPYLNLPLRDELEVRRELEQRDAERLARWREIAAYPHPANALFHAIFYDGKGLK